MKDIMLAIMAQLEEKVKDLHYIAEDYGQVDFYETEPPVKFPCALISISNLRFDNVGSYDRNSTITVMIRLVDDKSVFANQKSSDDYKNRAFAILDLIDEVGAALHGFGGHTFKKLIEKTGTPNLRNDALREYALMFETGRIIKSA